MEEEKGFRRFLLATREKALEIADQSHLSAEARSVIKDFIEISKQTENLLKDRHESSADTRVLSKRYDAAKVEIRELQGRMNKVKEVFSSDVTSAIKALSSEVTLITDKGQQARDPVLIESASRIRAQIKKLVEVFSKI